MVQPELATAIPAQEVHKASVHVKFHLIEGDLRILRKALARVTFQDMVDADVSSRQVAFLNRIFRNALAREYDDPDCKREIDAEDNS